MGDIFFGEKQVNAVIAAHASEDPATDKLLQQGRDATFKSSAKLADQPDGAMSLTTLVNDKPQSQLKVKADPVRDTAGVLEFAKNEASAITTDSTGRIVRNEKVVIAVPLQFFGWDKNPKMSANITDTIFDGSGRTVRKYEGSCTTRRQSDNLQCDGTWKDGNNNFIMREQFTLKDTSKVSNYYDSRGRSLGKLNTSIASSDSAASTQTKME